MITVMIMKDIVLNPDVSVRSRGIMEKCSMCVQRIQEGKLEAKKQRRDLKDGDIKVACQQSCPSDAIVFGDKNNKESLKVAQFLGDDRNYVVLEELNVQPRISYMTKIRNK
jgi:Fe-S-cluster-containing dehydrogenase component